MIIKRIGKKSNNCEREAKKKKKKKLEEIKSKRDKVLIWGEEEERIT